MYTALCRLQLRQDFEVGSVSAGTTKNRVSGTANSAQHVSFTQPKTPYQCCAQEVLVPASFSALAASK